MQDLILDEATVFTKIAEASQAYYETGEDIMSDAAFDSLWEFGKKLNPNHPIFKSTGKGYKLSGIDDKEKFQHPIEVGSVSKINEFKDLLKWISKKRNRFTLTTKIDGNSIVCYYKNKRLWKVVTRGSENIGIERIAKFISIIPHTISVDGYIAVRGEAAIKKTNYKTENGFDISKASRSSVSGAITRKENWETVFKFVDFIAYTFIDCDTGEDLYSKYNWSEWFTVEAQKDVEITSADQITDIKTKYKDNYEYDADGIVLKAEDGELVAFKFEDDSAVTQLLDIEWTIGKDQRLTPVALLSPTELAGATISRASMGSFSRALDINAWPVGQTHEVRIKRANEIIPYVMETTLKSSEVKDYSMPKCPICQARSVKDGEHAFCKNPSCGNIEDSRLMNFASNFYPEGIGDTIVAKMFSAYGIETVMDLLEFNSPLTQEVYGVGESHKKLFKKMLAATKGEIDVKIVYKTYLTGCGNTASTKIVDSGFDLKFFLENPSYIKKLKQLSNFNSNIIDELVEKTELIREFCNLRDITQIKTPKKIGTFCITGVRFKPDQLSEIVAAGWGEDSSVKKTTTVLVTKDPSSSSSKIVKAKEYGILVMTVDEFLNHIK